MKKLLCTILIVTTLLSTISAFAMTTNEFDRGMAKGISYFNRGLYYESRDEFQWFCDYNWGAMNPGQQKYALDYLDAAKAKIWEWENVINYVPEITFSAPIGEVNGVTYSTRNVPGLKLFPVRPTNNANIDSFCYYDGFVYYIESNGDSVCEESWLYRCKPNCTEKRLVDKINDFGERFFFISNGILYYDAFYNDNSTTAINLSTLNKYKTKKPNITINDNGYLRDRSSYSMAVYNDICFFIDSNHNLYMFKNGTKKFIASNAYSIDGFANGCCYYSSLSYGKIYLYRVSIDGGNAQYIDSHMAAGGGFYFNY